MPQINLVFFFILPKNPSCYFFGCIAQAKDSDEPSHIPTIGKFMKKQLSRINQLGQGMTEYIIIVALIAVAAIAVSQLFGATIRNQIAGIAMEVSGKDGSEAITKAGTAAGKAKTDAATNKGLATYGAQATNGAQ